MIPTTNNLRDWADNPAASGMVPVSPTSLRAVADLLDAQDAELAALKAGLAAIRDCFSVPAHGSALEDAWSEAMGAPEGIAAYVLACVDAQAAEIAALKFVVNNLTRHSGADLAETALRQVLAVVQRYLPPDSNTSANAAMSKICSIVDPWPLATPWRSIPVAAIAQAVQPADHTEDALAMVRPVVGQAVQPK